MMDLLVAMICAPFMLLPVHYKPSIMESEFIYANRKNWQKPTVKGVTEAIIECEKNVEYSKIGLEPLPAKYYDTERINNKKKTPISFESIDRKLANMQMQLAFIREEIRALREK